MLACPREDVVFAGAYTLVETGHVKQIGSSAWQATGTLTFNLNGLTAVGQTSGTQYRVTGVTSTGFTFTFGTAQTASTSRFVQTWRLLPAGGGTSLSFHEVFDVVYNANQRLVAFVQQGPADCN